MEDPDLVPAEQIQSHILVIRGLRVMLDADLARLYGVTPKRLNEQVKRNLRRFPDDFMFQLTREEAEAVRRSRSQNATLKRGQHIKHLPYAFTEHGTIQAANVIKSTAAELMGIAVVRAFARLRQMLVNHKALATKLAELEARIGAHDEQLAALVDVVRQLAMPEATAHTRKIGFHQGNR
jgi:hypothetical protein